MLITLEGLTRGEHLPYRIGNTAIYLDGEQQYSVVECLVGPDGYVEKYETDDKGNFVFDGDAPRIVLLRGEVEIRMVK